MKIFYIIRIDFLELLAAKFKNLFNFLSSSYKVKIKMYTRDKNKVTRAETKS